MADTASTPARVVDRLDRLVDKAALHFYAAHGMHQAGWETDKNVIEALSLELSDFADELRAAVAALRGSDGQEAEGAMSRHRGSTAARAGRHNADV